MAIYFRLKNEKDFSSIPISGASISLRMLKQSIMEHRNLSLTGGAPNLEITKADTGEAFTKDEEHVPRDTWVLVKPTVMSTRLADHAARAHTASKNLDQRPVVPRKLCAWKLEFAVGANNCVISSCGIRERLYECSALRDKGRDALCAVVMWSKSPLETPAPQSVPLHLAPGWDSFVPMSACRAKLSNMHRSLLLSRTTLAHFCGAAVCAWYLCLRSEAPEDLDLSQLGSFNTVDPRDSSSTTAGGQRKRVEYRVPIRSQEELAAEARSERLFNPDAMPARPRTGVPARNAVNLSLEEAKVIQEHGAKVLQGGLLVGNEEEGFSYIPPSGAHVAQLASEDAEGKGALSAEEAAAALRSEIGKEPEWVQEHVPKKLQCKLTSVLLRDAAQTPCCREMVSYALFSRRLTEDDFVCPLCGRPVRFTRSFPFPFPHHAGW